MLRNSSKFLRLHALHRTSTRKFTNILPCVLTQSTKTACHPLRLLQQRLYSNPLPPSNNLDEVLIDANTYEIVCEETLEALCDFFDQLVESDESLKDADVMYSGGVLTVNLGSGKGTYVINRQSPNRQIWLSSPTSGPKRYDFVPTNDKTGGECRGFWVYKHDGRKLHELLQEEIPKLVNAPVNFLDLPYASAGT